MTQDMTPQEIEHVLKTTFYGHLGCSSKGKIYVVPVTYVYDDNVFYGYTHEGKKIEIMRGNPHVCLQVEQVKNGHNWQSVVCNGTCEEITDEKEIQECKLLIAERYASLREQGVEDPYFPLVRELSEHNGAGAPKPVLYRIKVEEKTGKKEA